LFVVRFPFSFPLFLCVFFSPSSLAPQQQGRRNGQKEQYGKRAAEGAVSDPRSDVASTISACPPLSGTAALFVSFKLKKHAFLIIRREKWRFFSVPF
jgi:hypothetical protein